MRLEIIAADVDLAGFVIRMDPDHPPCFRQKRLNNGEKVECKIEATFDALVQKAASAIRAAMRGPPPSSIERMFISVDT